MNKTPCLVVQSTRYQIQGISTYILIYSMDNRTLIENKLKNRRHQPKYSYPLCRRLKVYQIMNKRIADCTKSIIYFLIPLHLVLWGVFLPPSTFQDILKCPWFWYAGGSLTVQIFASSATKSCKDDRSKSKEVRGLLGSGDDRSLSTSPIVITRVKNIADHLKK